MDKKILTSMRLSKKAKDLIKVMAASMSLSQTGVIEVAIRRMAKDEGLYGAASITDMLKTEEDKQTQ